MILPRANFARRSASLFANIGTAMSTAYLLVLVTPVTNSTKNVDFPDSINSRMKVRRNVLKPRGLIPAREQRR